VSRRAAFLLFSFPLSEQRKEPFREMTMRLWGLTRLLEEITTPLRESMEGLCEMAKPLGEMTK
jgi:hypothetical protein